MNSPGKGALGRGLGALLPGTDQGVLQVEVELIDRNPQQPRDQIEPEALAELTNSIREHGVLQPLIVTRTVSHTGEISYRLIAGERRLQAARQAGLARVPVIVREATDSDRLQLALVENLQRADLSPLEEAHAYHRLIEEFGQTQEEVARHVGKGRVAVANAVRLLGLSDAIKGRLASGEITAGHARALLGTPDEQLRLGILRLILEQGLNVRQTEALVRETREASAQQREHRPASQPDPERESLEERLRAALGTQVQLVGGRNGGRIVIRYYDEEDLQEILAILLRGRA